MINEKWWHLFMMINKIQMKVSELIKELQKYPEDAEVLVEWRDNEFGKTYLEEPWLSFEEEIKYNNLEWDITYANPLNYDWVMNNVLVIS